MINLKNIVKEISDVFGDDVNRKGDLLGISMEVHGLECSTGIDGAEVGAGGVEVASKFKEMSSIL